MSQTSYPLTMAVGRAGMQADNGPRNVVSKNNQSGAVVPFGVAVCKGAADNEATLPSDAATAAACIGVTMVDLSVENRNDGNVPSYPVGAMMAVGKGGRFWVNVEEAVNNGDAVYVRYAAGAGGAQKGAFRKSADTATAAAWAKATYRSTQATPGGLAEVEVTP